MKQLLCLFSLILTFSLGISYKILVVFHPPGKSHSILGAGFVEALLEAGHEVTYVTPFIGQHSHPNYTEVDISRNLEVMSFKATVAINVSINPSYSLGKILNIETLMNDKTDINSWKSMSSVTLTMDRLTLSNENMQKLMQDPNAQFDAVIVEWFYSDIHTGLSAVFNCPFIWFLSTEPAWMQLELIDEALNPAYTSDPFSLAAPPFDFKNRITELWNQIYGRLIREIYLVPEEKVLHEEFFGPAVRAKGRSLPAFDEVKYNASLMLGNSHVSMGSSIRQPPNYKPIGGFHIKPEIKPLPEDVQRIMDDSKNGVIYFSMGTNLQSKNFPVELKLSLLKMFGELKYTVIWKLEEPLPNIPKNVHILKWAPQASILSHPNCVVFITHGGLLSTTETVHFGIPIIGIPVYADQFVNVGRAVVKGYARKVELSNSIAPELKRNIEEIMSNPSYAARAKKLSSIYHDRVASPRQELVHWVEHVVRTGGAPHLRSPALAVPLYQKYYLDLAALLLAAFLILMASIKRLIQLVTSKKVDHIRKNK